MSGQSSRNDYGSIITDARPIFYSKYTRSCDCEDSKDFQKGKRGSRPKLNCLNGKEWLKSMLEVREFFYTKQDIRDKNIHPSMFPVQLPEFFIKLFTHPGELVVDPFAGLATTAIAARNLNRHCICLDIERRYVLSSNQRIKKVKNKGKCTQKVCLANVASPDQLDKHLQPDSIKLIITSPPYANILTKPRDNKSRRTEDRVLDKHKPGEALQPVSGGNIGLFKPGKWQAALAGIFGGLMTYMHPHGHVVVNISDAYQNGRRELLSQRVINALTDDLGYLKNRGTYYEMKNILIWDKRKLISRTGIFGWPSNYISLSVSSEYLLHFEVKK